MYLLTKLNKRVVFHKNKQIKLSLFKPTGNQIDYTVVQILWLCLSLCGQFLHNSARDLTMHELGNLCAMVRDIYVPLMLDRKTFKSLKLGGETT